MFSRGSSTPPIDLDDAHLEVTVTPSASAFYAGETFSAVITLRNTRIPPHLRSIDGTVQPSSRPHPTHLLPLQKRSPSSAAKPASPDTPTFSPDGKWRGEHARRPSGMGHQRRSQSLALDKSVSSQEMIWALGGGDRSEPSTPLPPPLPTRRTPTIPLSHPHARKISVASTAAFNSPNPDESRFPTSTPPLQSDSETSTELRSGSSERLDSLKGPTPLDVSRNSVRLSPSPTPSLPNVAEESPTRSTPRSSPVKDPGRLFTPDLPSPSGSPGVPSPGSLHSTLSNGSDRRRQRPLHARSPSYHHTAFGHIDAPPLHPQVRSKPVSQVGTTTVLWAHTRLIARFAPSTSYIPPDPLLPLRSRLLHQPIGSGSLIPSSDQDKSTLGSRWVLNFGTGTIGHQTRPSLTGSLFGLAKSMVGGAAGGSLEEERRRVWNTHDLPVLETTRSLMGVDIKLGEGETKEYVYTLQLPSSLPPAFKGKAMRFSYDLIISLNVSLPGGGKRQRTKEISVPVRIWPNVSLPHPLSTYNILDPVIQTKEEGTIVEQTQDAKTPLSRRRNTGPKEPPQPKSDSLAAYARQLMDTVEPAADGHIPVPPSPSKPFNPLTPKTSIRTNRSPTKSDFFLSPEPERTQVRPRSTSIVAGDDELVEETQKCGEVVQILSRHSPKASFDITKDGEVVAVLTLIKTAYRLGETVTGVVTFNEPKSTGRVIKFSAYLETHELIPETLLPPSASEVGRVKQPDLRRVHAEFRSSYAVHTSRTPFSLDIPSDATPAFGLVAGSEPGRHGGLQWRLKLAFLVASPEEFDADEFSEEDYAALEALENVDEPPPAKPLAEPEVLSLVPVEGDCDNGPYTAAPGLAPYFVRDGEWSESETQTVQCEVPIQVLAGNTAFVVRPSNFTV